jgi:WD40 repeat protein
VHTKSVNSVRWSPDGLYLASGSDDSYIIIYKYTPDKPMSQSFGSKPISNKENWSRCFTLQGHTMDILDIHWSPRGLLASASIDNKIMIWNPYTTSKLGSYASMVLNPIKALHGHQSFVRGVSFDATGKYLTSSGADNIIILWDADNNFKEVRRIRNPMKESPDRSLFRRMDWGPDGFSLCITAAMKSGKPVGNILKRKTWDIVADLVGHSAATSTCRFFPQLLNRDVFLSMHGPNQSNSTAAAASASVSEKKKSDSASESMDAEGSIDLGAQSVSSDGGRRKSLRLQRVTIESEDSASDSELSDDTSNSSASSSMEELGFKLPSSSLSCAVAIGDQAGVVSLWGSHSNRALLVLRDIVQGPVTDIAWLSSSSTAGLFYGKTIFACSGLDGSVVIVDLEDEVLGEVIAKDHPAFDIHIQNLYGKKLDELVRMQAAPITMDAEPASSLSLHRPPVTSRPLTSSSSSSSSAMTAPAAFMPLTLNRMIHHQAQSQTKDGKKRIRPMLVQEDGSPMPSADDAHVPTYQPSYPRPTSLPRPTTTPMRPQYLKIVIKGQGSQRSIVTLPRLFSSTQVYRLAIDDSRSITMTWDAVNMSTAISSSSSSYEIKLLTEVSCIKHSVDDDLLILGTSNGHLGFYSLANGSSLLPQHASSCVLGSAIAFIDIFHSTVAVMSVDGRIRVWSVQSQKHSLISKYQTSIDALLTSLSSMKTIVEKFGFNATSGQLAITIKACSSKDKAEQGMNKMKRLEYSYDSTLDCWLAS